MSNFEEDKTATIKLVGESFWNLQYEVQLAQAKRSDRSGHTQECLNAHPTKASWLRYLDSDPSVSQKAEFQTALASFFLAHRETDYNLTDFPIKTWLKVYKKTSGFNLEETNHVIEEMMRLSGDAPQTQN